MSLRVRVIPEDPTYNGAILKPLIERMLSECGKPAAHVKVLTNPKLSGIEDLRKQLPAILERYSFEDMFVVVVDADGQDRQGLLDSFDRTASDRNLRLFACAAVEEVETWLLAGHAALIEQPWAEVRNNIQVKEEVFQPFLARHGNPRLPDGGREELMRLGLKNYQGILQRCPELAGLEAELREYLKKAS